MRRLLQTALWGLASMGWFAAAGCGKPFEPEARLTKLRVLAIRAEPVNPPPGASTTFEPLVYAPPDTSAQTFTYAWSWCPVVGEANDGYACPIDQTALERIGAALGMSTLPSLLLGTSSTQAFTNPFSFKIASALCAQGFEGTFPDCAGGFPIRLKVTIAHAGATVTATTVLRVPLADDAPVNANPAFDATQPALAARIGDVEVPIDDQGGVTLKRIEETELRAHVADAEAESYTGNDDTGAPALLRERLVLTWFVESGDVVPDFHTGYFPGQTDIAALLANKWKPGSEEDYAPARARVVLVLRDDRGGVGWTSGSVTLEPNP